MHVDILKIDPNPSIRDNERIRVNNRRMNDILSDLNMSVAPEHRTTWASNQKWILSSDELHRTLQEDGEFYFWTCGCGVPGCIGDSPIIVWREADFIFWQISSRCDTDEVVSETLKFHLPQYRRELGRLLAKPG
jgi:hypothetical protein